MRLIETEEAAARLARVILSDIELYNKDKIGTGADLSAEIEEGYTLFRQRVSPALVPLFKTVLKDRGFARGGAPGTVVASGVPAAAQPQVLAPAPARKLTPAEVAEAAALPETPPPAATPAPGPAPVLKAVPAPEPAPPSRPVAAPEDVATPEPAQPSLAAAAAAGANASPRPVARVARKGPIDGEDEARRLARVIASDIKIYNTAKIASGGDISGEINEGRTLFKGRVVPALHGIFDEVLADKGLAAGKPAARAEAPAARPEPVVEARPAPAAESRVPVPIGEEPTPVMDALPAPVERPRTAPAAEARPAPAAPAPQARPAPEPAKPAATRQPSSLTPKPRTPPPPVPHAARRSRADDGLTPTPAPVVPAEVLSALPSKISPLPKAATAPAPLPAAMTEEATEVNPVAPLVDLGLFSSTSLPATASDAQAPSSAAASMASVLDNSALERPLNEKLPVRESGGSAARSATPSDRLAKTPSKRLLITIAVGVGAAVVLALVLVLS
jgi:hypothetical protein